MFPPSCFCIYDETCFSSYTCFPIWTYTCFHHTQLFPSWLISKTPMFHHFHQLLTHKTLIFPRLLTSQTPNVQHFSSFFPAYPPVKPPPIVESQLPPLPDVRFARSLAGRVADHNLQQLESLDVAVSNALEMSAPGGGHGVVMGGLMPWLWVTINQATNEV